MTERVLIKLGGSVLTDKAGDCMIRHDRLEQIAQQVSGCRELDLIIVHGAGSCGHPEAQRHHLDKGLDQINKSGLFITHRTVRKLNDALVDTLRTHGAEAIGLHPLGAGFARDGRLIALEVRPIEQLVLHGIIPVLHGDVVMDLVRGACIISGDQLVSFLPRHMHIDRIGLATDVAGVLVNGSVIPQLHAKSVSTLTIGQSENTDVTGGMGGKIQELLTLADQGIESNIFHISRLGDFLKGQKHGGTVVLP
jgi:isopentenyl phosphate kinase